MQEHSDSLCGSHVGDKCQLIYESICLLLMFIFQSKLFM
jgi:hypothetical protein